MTRTIHRSFLAAILLAAIAIIGGTSHASAQVLNQCCTFRIVISNTFSFTDGCMPISVTTNWGIPGNSQTDVVTVTGTGNPPLAITPCSALTPPGLNWVSLDGGLTKYSFPGGPYQITLPCGLCGTLSVSTDPNGCLVVNLAGFCDL